MPDTAAERQKAAFLAIARIVSESVRKEREMWLRVSRQIREMTRG